MMKNLIIVESPTKSKTLSKFLGKDYQVMATMGHIRDLPSNKLGIEIESISKDKDKDKKYKFTPEYILLPKKKEAIKKLKDEASKAENIFLATDPDREGEAIAYHVAAILKEKAKGKDKKRKFLRITFHEITKPAIQKALDNPGEINLQLFDAQQARRILDRLVGYKLSPLLWRKIRRGLSAGRVQSVAVRLIVEREKEIEKFIPDEYWEIIANLKLHLDDLKDEAPSFWVKLNKVNGKTIKVENGQQAEEITGELKKVNWEVFDVKKKETLQNPVPPFTTSTLQQQAIHRLGFSGKKTMKAAQSLYEKGLITYHRTDSFYLSEQAISQFRDYIKSSFGHNYLPEKPRIYKNKSKVAQEAHEAIRPTDIRKMKQTDGFKDEDKLYDLIWKRALASQMASAVWDKAKIEVQAAGEKNIYLLTVDGKVIKFDGWRRVYGFSKKENGQEEELPDVKKGEDLDLVEVKNEQKFTQPLPRFNEASLIKTLEELGIGRPSTYVPIISTIQIRQYVEKEEGKFKPTSLGEVVNDFLVEYFPQVFDYQFTAQMEDELDDIAKGEREWMPVINEFYAPFEEKLSAVSEIAKRVQVPTEATGEKCPECKKGQVVIRIGRFGKFLSCSKFPDCKYTAPYVLKVEGAKCPDCGSEVVIKRSRKGKQFYGCAGYPKCKWASWKKPQ